MSVANFFQKQFQSISKQIHFKQIHQITSFHTQPPPTVIGVVLSRQSTDHQTVQDLFGNAVGVVGLQQDGRVDAGRQHNAIATRVRVDKVGKIQHTIAIDAPMHGRRPIA